MLSVAILAAGKGTRMESSLPKVLHKISGKSLLQRVIDSCVELKPGKIFVITGHKSKEVQKSIPNDKKIQVVRNVDDEINIDLSKLNADGSTSSLDAAITVDLLTDSYVTSQQVGGANRINLTGASPDFTRDEFLAHVQARVNEALNTYASSNTTQKAALGIEKLQFTRAAGTTISTIYETNDVISFTHTSSSF